ncbi:MAG: SUMF1/EgtB/PvdO family nonheme iron enzyme [Acidobacteriaceae bacterium]
MVILQTQGTRQSGNIAEPKMNVISAGLVRMGLPTFPADSRLPHRWTETVVDVEEFSIAKFAVTVGEYLAFADATNYAIAPELQKDERFRDSRAPVAYTSWIDAVRYAQWLARETGKPYRLVRDAEFEKAARGGLEGKLYPWGDEPPEGRCDYNNPNGSPQIVGSYAANGYGVHDMAGSMWSWCEECYEQVAPDPSQMCYDDTQIKDKRLNPVCRGGSFKSADATVMRCAYRHDDPIDGRFDCIGFRLALSH